LRWIPGRFLGAAAAAALVLGTASAAVPASAAAPVHGGTLNVGVFSDFVTLDPMASGAVIDREALLNIYDSLVQYTPTGTIAPDLATSWSVSKNGLVYTFHLRHGVTFQDGTPFNAQAVVFNFNRDVNPKNASPRASSLADVTSAKAVGPYEVVYTLKAPFAPFLGIMAGRAGMMASPAAVKKYGAQFGQHPVGAGPFAFSSWVTGESLTLNANPHYWQKGKPYVSQVVFHVVSDPTVKLQSLETGQLQIIDSIAPQDISSAQTNKSIVFHISPETGWTAMFFNTTKAPFTNVHLREAVNFALNRAALNKVIYFNHAQPDYQQFAPSSWAYSKSVSTPYSIADAKAQLKMAGDPNGFTFTILGNNDPTTIQELQAIASQLAQAGITMKIQLVDAASDSAALLSGDFQASLDQWSGRYDPDQNSYAFDVTGGSFNYARFSNPNVDKILNTARLAQSQAERKTLYIELSKILLQQDPYIFLLYAPNDVALAHGVNGFTYFPDGLLRLGGVWLSHG